MAALEGEVRHLKHKVRGHHEEKFQLIEKVRDIESLVDQKEKEQQQLHEQLHDGQQQVRKDFLFSSSPPLISTFPTAGSIDLLNSDSEAVKETHEIVTKHRSQRSVALHSRLNQNNSEISQTQSSRRIMSRRSRSWRKSAARRRRELSSGFTCQSMEPWSYSKTIHGVNPTKKEQSHTLMCLTASDLNHGRQSSSPLPFQEQQTDPFTADKLCFAVSSHISQRTSSELPNKTTWALCLSTYHIQLDTTYIQREEEILRYKKRGEWSYYETWIILGSHVTAMNAQMAGQMRVKAMCFPSYLMKAVCFYKAQAPDYGHKKAMVFPLSLVTRPFIQQQKLNAKSASSVWTLVENT